MYNFITKETILFSLTTKEILLMCALLCSTDVVAAISIIKYHEQPKIFSIIFGEGIINDAVCIIIFNTVILFSDPKYEFTYFSTIEIAYSFLYLAFVSVIIGTLVGLFSALLLKHFRILSGNSIHETVLIFCFGYIAYVLAEFLGLSGIISLLASGISMAHYTYYNISTQGREVSTTSFQAVGFWCEAFCFAYLGLTYFSYAEYSFSWQLFLMLFLIIIVGRATATIGLIQLLRLFGHSP